MKISCCIIGKNEVNDIGRCLASIINKVYEIIYVDTGSEDGTVEYIKEFYPSVKTFFYKWNDDFAAARNYSISKAKGDYIFYIDCDEEFVGSFPSDLEIAVYNLNINNLTDSGNYTRTQSPRLIYREKGLKFIETIHERFDTSLPIKNFQEGYIVHYGYLTSYVKNKDKVNRNIKSLEKVVNPDATTLYYLSREYLVLEKYEESQKLATKGIHKLTGTPIHNTFKPLLYEIYLHTCIQLDQDEAINTFEKLMLEECNNPECYMLLLRWYIKKDREDKILYYTFNTVKWLNAEKLPVKLVEKNIMFMPFVLTAAYYLTKDKLMSLYFLELAVSRGLRDKRIVTDIIDLMPKSERNIAKFNYYEALLEKLT